MSWIEELDEGMFKEFILDQYEEWLEDFEKVLEKRLEKYDKQYHELLQNRIVEVYNEISKVRGMY